MKIHAFSLVELLIVIAIIAILAAIAVPKYVSYIDRAKYSAMNTFINSLIGKSITYHAQHGVWPNAAQLGFTIGIIPLIGVASEVLPTINPNLGELNIGQIPGADCANVSGMEYSFVEGYTDYTDAALFWYFAEIDGVIHITCIDESPTGNDIVGTACIDPNYPTVADLNDAVC